MLRTAAPSASGKQHGALDGTATFRPRSAFTAAPRRRFGVAARWRGFAGGAVALDRGDRVLRRPGPSW
ncbi:MAG: hypothetical protein ACMG6S_24055 [Byssovorax sp.]